MTRRGKRQGRKPKRLKPASFESLLIRVKYYVIASGYSITAEDLAKKYNVQKHYITQCFQILNRQGLLSQALNYKGLSYSWRRTLYFKRTHEDDNSKE